MGFFGCLGTFYEILYCCRRKPICQPSAEERRIHELTHIPYRPWCNACVRGRAKDKMSLRVCGAYAGSTVPRVRLDYCYLTENITKEVSEDGNKKEVRATESVTTLVMQESVCRSV